MTKSPLERLPEDTSGSKWVASVLGSTKPSEELMPAVKSPIAQNIPAPRLWSRGSITHWVAVHRNALLRNSTTL